jgi:diguanylate cyclase (GGDEF)-like protein
MSTLADADANADADADTGANTRHDEQRLAMLRRDISAAESTLLALQVAILEAHSERGLVAMDDARAENERLQVQNHLMSAQADSAHAALEIAVNAAQTDSLTGVRNREVLWARLAHDLALARRHGHRFAIYFLDVDDFKHVNDQFGHAVGDLLLRHVAAALAATVRASDTVCRIGGDEFVVLAAVSQREDAEQVVAKMQLALGAPCELGGYSMAVSASIGFSLFPDDGEAPGVLVQKADEAMYRAKRAGVRRNGAS